MADNIYLLEFNVEYKGLAYQEFLKNWYEETVMTIKAKSAGNILQMWKIVGERKAIIILKSSPDRLDELTMGLPISKSMGNQVHFKTTPLRVYEYFQTTLRKALQQDQSFEYINPVEKEGYSFYFVTVDVEYEGLELSEFLKNLVEEGQKAMEMKKEGTILDLWKVVGQRKVVLIMAAKSPDSLDETLLTVPLMRNMGNNAWINVKAIRKYEAFSKDLEKILDKK